MTPNYTRKNDLQNHHSSKLTDDHLKRSKHNQTFKDLSILFYTQQVAKIIKSYRRGSLIGIILLVIYYSQIIGMVFEENAIKSFSQPSINQQSFLLQAAQYIRCFRIYSIEEITSKGSQNNIGRSNDNTTAQNSSSNINNQSSQHDIAQTQINFSIFGITYNLFAISYILIQYTLWMMSNNYHTNNESEQKRQEQYIKDVVAKKFNFQSFSFIKKFFKSNGILNKFTSVILQTYTYIVSIPFSIVSFSLMFNTNSHFNEIIHKQFGILLGVSLFLTTFLINLLIVINDFDYSIRYRDFFGSRLSNLRWCYFILDLLASYICTQINDNMSIKLYTWLHMIYSLIRVVTLVYEFPFYFEQAQKYHFQGSFFYLLISILATLQIHLDKKFSFSILLFSLIPINYQICKLVLRWRESFYISFISEKNIQTISAFHLDYYVRKVLIPLCQLDIEQYMSSSAFQGLGVQYESIYASHIIHCQALGILEQTKMQDKEKNTVDQKQKRKSQEFQCFCQKYQVSELTLSNMNGHQQRKQFIIEYIYYLLNLSFNTNFQGQNNNEKTISKSTPQNIQFLKKIKPTYIYYLIQVASTPAKAYTEVFTVKQKYHLMTIQQQYMMELIAQDLNYEFMSFFEHSNFQNQRLKIGDVYHFDHVYRDSFSELSKGLKMKQEFFQFLNQDQIVLNDLVKQSQKTIIQIQIIEDSLINLFKMNPLHQRTLQISQIFLNHFDFRKRSLTQLILHAAYLNEADNSHQTRNGSSKIDFKINLFHQKSATAFFFSLQNKTILRLSDSFSKLFGVSSYDMIGKPISLLFPDYYFPHISSYMEKLIEEANIDLIKIGLYYTFIRTARESLYPVVMRVKLDFLNDQTFGLSCYMQKIENDKFYIICDQNFTFLDASSQLKTLLLKNFEQNKRKKNLSDLLQRVNIRNLIPILYGIEKFQELNQFDEQTKNSSNFERQTNFMQFNSILFLPTNKFQIGILQKQVKQEIYDVSQYFKEFKPSEFDSVQVTFSPIVQKSFNEAQKCFNIIQISKIKKFKKIHEINEHLEQVREKFQKYFSHNVEIQEYENTSKNNSFVREIQTYNTQGTYFQMDNQQSEGKQKEDSQSNPKKDANTLQEIDYFESNYLHDLNKKEKSTENQIINCLAEKQSSKYSEKADGQDKDETQHIQYADLEQQHQSYENYQANYQNEQSLYHNYQKDFLQVQENQLMVESLQIDNQQINNQGQNQEVNQSDLNSSNELKNQKKSLKKQQKLIIKSPRANEDNNNTTVDNELKYQFCSPRFGQGQEMISPLSTHKDNEESQRCFVKSSANREVVQISQSASHLINGSLISPTIKVNEMYQESTIDDQQSQNKIKVRHQHFHNPKNNEKLLQIQPLSIDQYSGSHTSIEQEIKNNIQVGNKQILIKNKTNRQLSRKDIQTLERNVTKLYNTQHSKAQKNYAQDDNAYQRRDQYSQFKRVSNQGRQVSEQSRKEDKNSFQDDDIEKKMIDSQLFFKRQFLCDMVTKRQELVQVKYVRYIGAIFLILLVSISVALYLSLISYFNNGWDFFKDMLVGKYYFTQFYLHINQIQQKGYDILENYAQVIRQKEILFTMQIYGLPGYDFDNEAQMFEIQQEKANRQIQLKQLIDYFASICVRKGFETYMIEEDVQPTYNTQKLYSTVNSINLIYFLHIIYTKNSYTLLNIPLYLWDYSQSNNFDSLTYIFENYYNLMDMIAYLVDSSSTTSQNKIKSSENLLYISIGLIEAFCFILLMLIFPAYYIVQSKREDILKLLVTFDSNFLEKIVQKCNIEFAENKSNIGSSKTLKSIKTNKNLSSKNIMSQTQIPTGQPQLFSQIKKSVKKRKVVSQTNSLQKYSFSIILYSISMFIILSVYSITNFFLTRNFFSTFKYNIQEVSQVYQIQSLISIELTLIQIYTNSYLYQFSARDIGVVKNFKENILGSQFKERLSGLYQVDSNFQQDRDLMQEYKYYYLKTIKEDACQILTDKYDSNFVDEKDKEDKEIHEKYDPKIDPKNCTAMFNGKLQQGLTVTLKELINQFNQIYLTFTSANDELDYIEQFQLWCSQNNYYDLQQTYYYIRQIIRLLKEMNQNSSNEQFQNVKQIQLGLFIYIISICVLIFILLWIKFINNLNFIIYEARLFLSLIPIENLVENQYVISFINKQIPYHSK